MKDLEIEDLDTNGAEKTSHDRRNEPRTLDFGELRMVTGGECVATYSDNACACDQIV